MEMTIFYHFKKTIWDSIQEFGGLNIKSLNCSSVRRLIALVEQEPRLFDRTIEDNITFGSESRHVDMKEVIEAAKEANIHEFIMSLPDVINYLLEFLRIFKVYN